MGGSGVQRPLKFIKYLKEFGWNPIILCPEPGRYPYFDESLNKELEEISPEIIRIRPKTLFHVGRTASKQAQTNLSSSLAKALRRLSRFFMYPDNKKAWIKPAIEKGMEIIQEKDIQLIFSSAPPFSNHIAAAQLSKKSKIPLVLDYRDLWLNNHFFDDMYGWQKRKMRSLEKFCLESTDAVIGLDTYMLDDIIKSYPEIEVLPYVVPHGYDPADFDNEEKECILNYKEGKLNFLYSGLFYEHNQPDIFFNALKEADSRGMLRLSDIHLHFQGGLDSRIKKLIEKLGLKENVTDYGYISHEVAIANLKRADILWMISNFDASHKQIKSGKLFEYFGTRKPILGLMHEGMSSKLLKEYGAGFHGDLSSTESISLQMASIYEMWKEGEVVKPNLEFLIQYNRKNITKQLAQIFDKISS